MAVTLNTGLTITTLVAGLFPVAKGHVAITMVAAELDSWGYKVVVNPSTISIVVPESDGHIAVAASASLKADSLKLAMKNKIGFTAKNVIKQKIESLIDVAKAYSQSHPYVLSLKEEILGIYHGTISSDPKGYYTADSKFKVAAIKELRKKMGFGLKEAKEQVEAWVDEDSFTVTGTGVADGNYEPTPGIENPTYKSTKSAIMHLSDAEHLHQTVRGTSNGSRYYVVALGDDAKVAVRIKSGTDISIRAICTASVGSKEQVAVVKGFESASLQKAQGGHWSIHLHPTGMTMAERSIGATLFAMSIPFWAVTGDLKALVGK